MAGTDQSVNLTGMLNQIAGTVGQGYQIDGQSAGAAMGGLIANSVRPELDMNDEASVRDYAAWARNNGMKEEAMRYEAKAAELSAKTKTMSAMSSASTASEAGIAAANNGQVDRLQAQIKQAGVMMRQAAEDQNVEGMKVWRQTSQELQGLVSGAKANQSKNNVSKLAQMDTILKSGEDPYGNALSEQSVAAIEEKRQEMIDNDPDAARGYTEQLITNKRLEDMEREQQNMQAVSTFMQNAAGKSIEEMEALYESAPKEAKAAILGPMNALIDGEERKIARAEKSAMEGTQIASDDYVQDIQTRIDALPESAKRTKEELTALLEGAKKTDDSLFVNGTYSGPGAKTARAAWDRTESRINTMIAGSVAAAEQQENKERIDLQDQIRRLSASLELPDEREVATIMKNDGVTAKKARSTLRKKTMDAIALAKDKLDPESKKARMAAAQKGYSPDWSKKQQLYIDKLVENQPAIGTLLAEDEEGQKKLIKKLKNNPEAWQKWKSMASPDAPVEADPYPRGLIDVWGSF